MAVQKHEFEDGDKVKIKETGEIVTVDYWWFITPNPSEGIYGSCAQYNIKEKPGTWFAEYELEKVNKDEIR